jgi:hypothetical protein
MSAFVPKADIDSIKETLTCAVQTPREALSKTAGFRNPGAAACGSRHGPKPCRLKKRAGNSAMPRVQLEEPWRRRYNLF